MTYVLSNEDLQLVVRLVGISRQLGYVRDAHSAMAAVQDLLPIESAAMVITQMSDGKPGVPRCIGTYQADGCRIAWSSDNRPLPRPGNVLCDVRANRSALIAYRHALDSPPTEFTEAEQVTVCWDGNTAAIHCHSHMPSVATSFVMILKAGQAGARELAIGQHAALHFHDAIMRRESRYGQRFNNPQSTLTGRELEIIRWLRDGKTNGEIGQILSITERTVKFHISNMCGKLNAVNRCQVLGRALQLGLLETS